MTNKAGRKYARDKLPHLFLQCTLADLKGKTFAIDFNNIMYKTFADPYGESIDPDTLQINYEKLWLLWVERIVDFILTLLENEILPIAVFDGNVGDHKFERIRRSAKSDKIKTEMLQLQPYLYDYRTRSRYVDLMKRSYRLPKESYAYIPSLLEALGVPVLHTNGEAETLCCLLQKHGIVDGVWSEDFDNIAYGCTLLVFGFMKGGRGRVLECMDARMIFSAMNMTHQQFVEWYILCGCDYNEATLNLVGPAKAFEWIHTYGYIENIPISEIIKGKSRTTDERHKLRANVSRKIFLYTTIQEVLTNTPLLSYNNYININILGGRVSDDKLMRITNSCFWLAQNYVGWIRVEEYNKQLPELNIPKSVSIVNISLEELLN
jgi:flap endonuclease-1